MYMCVYVCMCVCCVIVVAAVLPTHRSCLGLLVRICITTAAVLSVHCCRMSLFGLCVLTRARLSVCQMVSRLHVARDIGVDSQTRGAFFHICVCMYVCVRVCALYRESR